MAWKEGGKEERKEGRKEERKEEGKRKQRTSPLGLGWWGGIPLGGGPSVPGPGTYIILLYIISKLWIGGMDCFCTRNLDPFIPFILSRSHKYNKSMCINVSTYIKTTSAGMDTAVRKSHCIASLLQANKILWERLRKGWFPIRQMTIHFG